MVKGLDNKIKERSEQLSKQMLKQRLKFHGFKAKMKLAVKLMALIVLIAIVLSASWFAFKHGAGRLVFDAILALLGAGMGLLVMPLFWCPFFQRTTVKWGKQWLLKGYDFRHDYKGHLLFYAELLGAPLLLFVLYFVSLYGIFDAFCFLTSFSTGFYIVIPVAITTLPAWGFTMDIVRDNFGGSWLYPDAFLNKMDRLQGDGETECWAPVSVVWALLHMSPKNK